MKKRLRPILLSKQELVMFRKWLRDMREEERYLKLKGEAAIKASLILAARREE